MQELIYDPRDVVNKYDSFAGLGIIVLHFIGLAWMYYACFFTIKHYRGKAVFYIPFISIFTLWFLASPIIIWMSNNFLAKWERAKIVNGFEMTVMFYGHVVFLLLTRPDANNQYFPFHLKVNMVGIMNDDDVVCDEEKPKPPMFSSLFNASQVKYVMDSECQETIYESPVVPINFNRHTSNEDVAVDNLPSSGTVKLCLSDKEADLLPKGRFILVKAFVEDN
ncbi:transmembrane protein 145-like [Anneissia japonica]|uniref:transmembrane protein 145-like n=1 Tax=Anneissia japonica TaxID=1529436 RepID=UPI0014258599|nr:transmembrane protein 145-like [Anneissia japonica]